MNELMTISTTSEYPINGRELHSQLGIESNYTTWFKRMCEYGFSEGTDFIPKMEESTGGRPQNYHSLTLSMAKELCMLQRTDKGREVRRYLIDVESAWNSPDAIMERALSIAHARVQALQNELFRTTAENSALAVQAQIMKPKADYFDELVERSVNLSFRETAKQLQIKERVFVGFLLDHKYIYRDKKGKLMPYSQYTDCGLFVVKECFNEKTQWGGTQTLITPKGRETFLRLMEGVRV